MGKYCLMGPEFRFEMMENVLAMDGVDGRPTKSRYSMPLNCIF